jgi:hypothetical protein
MFKKNRRPINKMIQFYCTELLKELRSPPNPEFTHRQRRPCQDVKNLSILYESEVLKNQYALALAGMLQLGPQNHKVDYSFTGIDSLDFVGPFLFFYT